MLFWGLHCPRKRQQHKNCMCIRIPRKKCPLQFWKRCLRPYFNLQSKATRLCVLGCCIVHSHIGRTQDMLPAGRSDRTLLQSIEWHSALRIKQAIQVEVDVSSNGRQCDENDSDSLFCPSFTMLCDAKEVQRKLFCEKEEMLVIIEQSEIDEQLLSDDRGEASLACLPDYVTIQRFLTHSFRSALAPLATEICKTIIPSLCQNLCICVDLFEDSDRARIFEFFRVNRWCIHFDVHLLYFLSSAPMSVRNLNSESCIKQQSGIMCFRRGPS